MKIFISGERKSGKSTIAKALKNHFYSFRSETTCILDWNRCTLDVDESKDHLIFVDGPGMVKPDLEFDITITTKRKDNDANN